MAAVESKGCFICKSSLCSGTSSSKCQNSNRPSSSPRRFGIGGAGNLSTQSIKSSGSEEQWLINTANDTEKQRLSQDSGYSGTTFNSTTSRHCGIGGVGNVVPKQAFVSSAISSVKLTSENRNIAGMGIAYRRFGIGGAGNVILRK